MLRPISLSHPLMIGVKWWWVFVLIFGVDLQGQSSPHAFLNVQETFVFKVTYLKIVAGYASITTNPSQNTNQIHISLHARSATWARKIYDLNMQLTSISQKNNFATLYYEEDRLENKSYYYQKMRFFPQIKRMHYFKNKHESVPEKVPYISDALNVLSCLYFARTLDLIPKKIYHTHVYHHKQLHPVEIHIIKTMTLRTHFGKKNVILIEPRIPFQGIFNNTEKIRIYLSNDGKHIPFLIKSKLLVGHFKAELIKQLPPPK